MLPQQLTQNHIKRELMSHSFASKHTPPGHSNCCHCNLILACWLQISVPLVVCCKNFDSYFTLQTLWLFLCNCLRKTHWPLLCKRISYDTHIYTAYTVQHTKPTKRLTVLSSFMYVKMHIELVLNGEGNRGQSEFPSCTLLFSVFMFYTQEPLILWGDGHLLKQAEPSQLLLAPAPRRTKSMEAAESSKSALPGITRNRIAP